MAKKTPAPPDLSRWKLLPVSQLVRAEWNYVVDDDAKLAKLVGNLSRNSQVENIIVRELEDGSYEVVNGNHRLDAVHVIGWKEVVAYDLGVVTREEAIRLCLEVNETRFERDMTLLSRHVADTEEHFGRGEMKRTMPFSDDELAQLKRLAAWSWGDGSEYNRESTISNDGFTTFAVSMPDAAFDVFKSAVDKMQIEGTRGHQYARAIELWAADYLASA